MGNLVRMTVDGMIKRNSAIVRIASVGETSSRSAIGVPGRGFKKFMVLEGQFVFADRQLWRVLPGEKEGAPRRFQAATRQDIAEARKRDPGSSYLSVSGHRLPLEDSGFDVVVLSEVLEHVGEERRPA